METTSPTSNGGEGSKEEGEEGEDNKGEFKVAKEIRKSSSKPVKKTKIYCSKRTALCTST